MTQITDPHLLPCPFCGEDAARWYYPASERLNRKDSYHKLAEKTGIKAKSVANMCCTEKGGYYKVKLEKGEELE